MKKKIPKNVIWMSLASMFNDISSEMIFPILPLFLANVLKINTTFIGLIEGFAESTSSILKTFSGYVSDRLNKRKSIVALGYLLSTLTKPLLAISTLWQHVLAIRFLDRTGKGVREPPRDALIAASVNKNTRGKAFGFQRTFDTLGAVIGTMLAFAFLSLLFNYRTIFWISFIPAAISVLIIVFFVKEIKTKVSNHIRMGFNLKDYSKEFKIFIAISTLFALGNFSYAFFILKAQDFVSVAFIPLIYLLYNIFYAAFALPAGNLSDRLGRRNIIAIGYLLFGVAALGFVLIENSLYAWMLFAIYGISIAFREAVSRAYVTDLVSEDKRGTALGIYYTFTGLAIFPASLVAGFLWNFGSEIAFLYATILSIIATALLLAFLDKNH